MASYVAFTRVKRMEDLLIFRPFDRFLFDAGNLEGPELLLRVLRGENVDWEAIEAKHMPSYMCTGCDTKNFKAEFSEPQWKRKSERRFCKNCERILSCNGTRKQCFECDQWLLEDNFPSEAWKSQVWDKVACNDCGSKRQCRGRCGQ